MTNDESYITDLMVKSLIGGLNEEEQRLYDQWQAVDPRNRRLAAALLDRERLKDYYEEYRAIDSRGIWEAICAQLPDTAIS